MDVSNLAISTQGSLGAQLMQAAAMKSALVSEGNTTMTLLNSMPQHQPVISAHKVDVYA